MVQVYEITIGLSILLGWMLNDFYHTGMIDWKMFAIILAFIYINEKTAWLEKLSKWMRKSF